MFPDQRAVNTIFKIVSSYMEDEGGSEYAVVSSGNMGGFMESQ